MTNKQLEKVLEEEATQAFKEMLESRKEAYGDSAFESLTHKQVSFWKKQLSMSTDSIEKLAKVMM